MPTVLHDELAQLRTSVLRMMELVRVSLRRAAKAVLDGDMEKAGETVAGDEEINRAECGLDRTCLKLLALEQPVARDLRFIVGCMRMTVDIERIGDEAVDIAERAMVLRDLPPAPDIAVLTTFFEFAMAAYCDAVRAFSDMDAGLAESVCRREREAAGYHMAISRTMATSIARDASAMERSIEVSFIAHALKRVCGRAANLGESVIFIDKGLSVKHGCQEPLEPKKPA